MDFIGMFTGVSGVILMTSVSIALLVFAFQYGKKGKFKEGVDVALDVAPDIMNVGKMLANTLIPKDHPKRDQYEKWFGYINTGIEVVDDLKEDLKENELAGKSNKERHDYYQELALKKAKEMASEFGGVEVDAMSETISKIAVSAIRNLFYKEDDVTDISGALEEAKEG
jgi:cbb3-type cytochrome oxidase subunit 3